MNILFIVFAIILVFIGGIFFVFGNDILQADFYDQVFSGELFVSNVDGDTGIGGGSDGGGSEVSSVSGGGSSVASHGCSLKRLSYSLRNFEENITCQEWDGDDCVSLSAICSVEVYNHDNDFSGDFEITYALVDSSDNELDSETLSQNITAGGNKLFSIDFLVSDNVDENSRCSFGTTQIPIEEICG